LGVSASAYYERATGRRSARAREDERLLGVIAELHERNCLAYGSRRMWKALLRSGEQVGRSRVERLMRQNGLQGAKRRGKPWRTTKPYPSAMRSPDLVQRDFQASRPDELWFANFTYLRCWDGLVFFSFVIDAYSRKIVGWQFASRRVGLGRPPRLAAPLGALDRVLARQTLHPIRPVGSRRPSRIEPSKGTPSTRRWGRTLRSRRRRASGLTLACVGLAGERPEPSKATHNESRLEGDLVAVVVVPVSALNTYPRISRS
jgi:transposase InsO family protein